MIQGPAGGHGLALGVARPDEEAHFQLEIHQPARPVDRGFGVRGQDLPHGPDHIVAIVRLDAGSIIAVDYYFSSALEPPQYHQRFATIVGH